uniref:RING-type domain-containing protein n=1 Tax=Branchiostoma floridae TaxID=7739 RepID=C3ZUN3_BRAFL|eukprot:XP_002587734.1 hypothetical protein BRAFLDRAFT_94637 [Branchiostoma floridae]
MMMSRYVATLISGKCARKVFCPACNSTIVIPNPAERMISKYLKMREVSQAKGRQVFGTMLLQPVKQYSYRPKRSSRHTSYKGKGRYHALDEDIMSAIVCEFPWFKDLKKKWSYLQYNISTRSQFRPGSSQCRKPGRIWQRSPAQSQCRSLFRMATQSCCGKPAHSQYGSPALSYCRRRRPGCSRRPGAYGGENQGAYGGGDQGAHGDGDQGAYCCHIQCYCARGFSTMKRIKTQARNHLKESTLDNLLMTSIEGPPAEDYDFEAAFNIFAKLSSTETTAECSICLEEYEINEKVLQLGCGHQFHVACVITWLNKVPTNFELEHIAIRLVAKYPRLKLEEGAAQDAHVTEE